MKITAIEAIAVRLPREREKAVRTAGSPTGLAEGRGDYRWSAVFPTLYPVHFETALVKITLEGGLTGWGEAQAPLAPEVACAIIDRLLSPVLLEAEFEGSIEEIERFWDSMYAAMRVRGQTGGFMLDAISGVDLALWDLAGKIQEKPVCELIPGSLKRPEVPAYHSGIPGATIEARVASALRRQAEGFRQFKIFYDCVREEFLESFRALRGALGADASLAVDALWRLTPEDAPAFGRALDEGCARWLEAPLMPEDALAHAALARRIRTPLAIGESYRTRYELAPFFRERAMGIVQPDLGRCGLTESLRIAAMAAEAGISVAPHLSIAMGPQIAAAIHFAAAIPNCDLLEYNPNVFEVANRFLTEPLDFDRARYSVPRRPGLGCDLKLS
ncbi:MAG TPA: mandelate racemase/muconate lactonizing enzyme family protein [Bryobacteraceae bacterium]|jgi:galactonate dehydratase|nr:mandelate racemase/muconate lactonizing enzyme family protein [Bryobacteraceae bacterium]